MITVRPSNRFLLVLLGTVLTGLLFTANHSISLAQQTVSLEVGSGTISDIPGSLTVPVTMIVPSGVSVRGVTLDVQYDNSIITASSGAASTQFVLSTCTVDTPAPRNTVRSSHFFWLGAGQVVLCDITFDAVADGTSNLTISVVELIDNSLNALPFTTTSGSITVGTPTAIDLISFTASRGSDGVTLAWETETESDNAGFNLHRATAEAGPYTQINPALIPAQGSGTAGASYSFLDDTALAEQPYYYKLEDIDFNSISTFHGPITVAPLTVDPTSDSVRLYLPLIMK